jgi:prepilin-type processing-associated H-X9-DG protein
VSLGREGFGSPKDVDYALGIWVCPSAQWNAGAFPTNWVPSCYGYNGYGLFSTRDDEATLGLGGKSIKGHVAPPTGETDVLNPSDMMAIGESLGGSILFAREKLERMERLGNSSTRHQGKANVAFCDGHVQSISLSYLDEATSDSSLARWNRDHQAHRDRLTR